MNFPIPYGKHEISEEDIQAVVDTLQSDNITQGPKLEEFEEAFASYIGSKYAVAVSSGTAALHLSARALGIGPGDKIITTPVTFAATANCVRFCGGEVVFCDIEKDSYLIDLQKLEELIDSSPPGTFKGIIPVDLAGRPVQMSILKNIAERHNLRIIEDSCHAPGGFFYDENNTLHYCGNCDFTELSIFSFHPVKHIACGEGGMVTTNSETLRDKIRLLRSHGITREQDRMAENHGGWYYEMQELGYNYRLTDIQAALGNQQLKTAEQKLSRRRQIARNYFNEFKNKPYILGQSGYVEGHAYHLYIIEIERRKELYEYLKENRILTQVHYIPLHYLPYYKSLGQAKNHHPVAEEYYRKCLSIPMFPSLTDSEQQYVIEKIDEFFHS